MLMYSGPDTRFEVTGLKPKTQYVFRVAAKNAFGVSDWSWDSLVQTEPAPFGAVNALSVISTGPSWIHVRWDDPSDPEKISSTVNFYKLEMNMTSHYTATADQIARAQKGEKASKLVESQRGSSLVMDFNPPGTNGARLTEEVSPDVKVEMVVVRNKD